jgi:ribosomal protein L11
VKQITYSVSGAQSVASTVVNGASASFTISTKGITTVTFLGTDNAGNVETAKTVTAEIDKTPSSITVFGKILNSQQEEEKDRHVVQIVIFGKITDSTSGVDAASATYLISDEDGIPQASGTFAPEAGGTYTLVVSFKKTRHRKDDDEHDRKSYKLIVSAKDNAGNQRSSFILIDRDHNDRYRHN